MAKLLKTQLFPTVLGIKDFDTRQWAEKLQSTLEEIFRKTAIRVEDAGLWLNVATKTAAYTLIDSDDVILCNATDGAFSITLPAAGNTGKTFFIKKIDSSANAVTVDGNGSETIDDATTIVLSAQYSAITVVDDGSEWWIMSGDVYY